MTNTHEHERAGGGGSVTCRDALERVFEWLDGELEPELQATVGDHLCRCAGCFPVLKFEKSFREALHGISPGVTPSEDLKQKILASLESAGLRRD